MRAATRIAAAYWFSASLWIVLSDTFFAGVGWESTKAQMLKGLLFVAVTTLILWVLVSRWDERNQRAYSQVEALKQRLAALVDTSPVAIVLIDEEGIVQLWNPAAERIFGWAAGEVVGQPNPIVPGPLEGEYRHAIESTLSGTMLLGERRRRQRIDGSLIDVLVYSADFDSGEGMRSGVMALFSDITEQVVAEQELQRHREHLEELVDERTRELNRANQRLSSATRIKTEFLANMSHELRTPLNSIIGFSGAMLQGMAGELNEEQRKQMGMVYRSGNHLLDLINDVLDLSKVEAGRMVAEPVAFDLAATIASLVESLEPAAREKGLTIALDLPGEALPMRSDRTKVRQILLNLVDNAVKFTSEGSVRISTSTDDGDVRISVTDTGPGIPREEREMIFDEFIQAGRHVLDAKPKGTGLGLAISRRLARILGGDIEVADAPGGGAVFTVAIPRELPEPSDVDRSASDTDIE